MYQGIYLRLYGFNTLKYFPIKKYFRGELSEKIIE